MIKKEQNKQTTTAIFILITIISYLPLLAKMAEPRTVHLPEGYQVYIAIYSLVLFVIFIAKRIEVSEQEYEKNHVKTYNNYNPTKSYKRKPTYSKKYYQNKKADIRKILSEKDI